MAKPHPYNFFTLQLDSMHENWICVHLCSYQSCEWVFEFYTLSTMTSLQPTQAQCADNWTWVGCNWLLKFKRGHLKFLVSGRSKQASKRTLAYAQWSHASVGLAQAHPNKSLSYIWTSCISMCNSYSSRRAHGSCLSIVINSYYRRVLAMTWFTCFIQIFVFVQLTKQTGLLFWCPR